MFSLIITIISIALVAVLALATLYYGGDAFNKGSAAAKAAQLINEGQQIAGALQLAEQDQVAADAADMTAIDTSAELVTGKYLQAVPAGYSTSLPLITAFDFAQGARKFDSNTVSLKVCQEVNKKAGLAATGVTAANVATKVYGCVTNDGTAELTSGWKVTYAF